MELQTTVSYRHHARVNKEEPFHKDPFCFIINLCGFFGEAGEGKLKLH